MGNDITKNPPATLAPTAQTGVTAAPATVLPAEEVGGVSGRKPVGPFMKFFQGLASLRLTVILFTLSLLLVFYGTVAQIDSGLGRVVQQYFRSWIVFIPVQLNFKVLQVFFGVPKWVAFHSIGVPGWWQIPAVVPFPAGYTLGFLLLFNLLAAHALRFKISWARGGIIILHLGMILLLLGELATAWSVEGSMSIATGNTANAASNNHKSELAIIDNTTDSKIDDTLAVPGRMLDHKGATVKDGRLPVDLRVVKWMVNSAISRTAPNPKKNLADTGFGVDVEAVELPEESGVSSEPKADAPSAYIQLLERGTGKDLGTYLFSVHHKPQSITVGDRTYEVGLRFQLVPKPYQIQVLEVRNDVYPGTNIPKNYSSRVRLIYPEQNENREVNIWMNNPMRVITGYLWGVIPRVDTLYQSQVSQDEMGNTVGTVLHVVDNSSWLMPYISCTMITLGMLWHFGIMVPALVKRASLKGKATTLPDQAPNPRDEGWLPWMPSLGAGLAILYFAFTALPVSDSSEGVRYQAFGRLPVQDGGRVQPLDSLARNTLLMLSDRTEVYEEKLDPGEKPKPEEDKVWVRRSAVRWLLEVQTAHLLADQEPRFKVDSGIALKLGLEPKERYSFNELRPLYEQLPAIARQLRGRDFEKMDPREQTFIRLAQELSIHGDIGRHLTPHRVFRIENNEVLTEMRLERREGFRYALEEFVKRLGRLKELTLEVRAKPQKEWTPFQAQIMKLDEKVRQYQRVAEVSVDLLIPPLSKPDQENWYRIDEAPPTDPEQAAVTAWETMLRTYSETKNPRLAEARTKEFNEALGLYQKLLDEYPLPAARSMALEQNFNSMSPFYQVLVFYVLADLLVLIGFVCFAGGDKAAKVGTALLRTAFWIAVVTVVVHTVALAVRMYLQGRPPVTNLYSSAIFIGWGCVLLGLFLDVIYRTGLGTLCGCGLGWVTSIVAIHLATSGDTMEMMRAVLDTNFWLATHVVAVTLGYTATLLAGGLGIVYIEMWLVAELSGSKLAAETRKALSQMIYGVVCFAMLLSFVGTVLGGIWADQSWGRFWGWDPKENGAVLIVIWNALILHARWAGMVKATGVAGLAVVGNMITVWSWFGTNQLGVGLHSYGFSNALGLFCVIMWVSHAMILCQLAIPPLLRLYGWKPPVTKVA